MKLLWGSHEIDYHLERASRKTVAITVRPDSSVVVRAPSNAEQSAIDRIVQRRASWILRQQNFFGQFRPRTPPREYIGGETHLYLGRRYRLRIRDGEPSRVALLNGYLHIFTEEPASTERKRDLLDAWYAERAEIVFTERFKFCRRIAAFADLAEPPLSMRRLQNRWGTCSAAGAITLNVDLVRAPRRCIDYVIIHELCHLVHHDHSRAFYRLLTLALPDWEEAKQLLERLLS